MIPYDCMIYFSKKQYDRCLEILEKESNKCHIDDDILFKKAEIYYELAKIENDINHLNEAESFINKIDDNNKTDNEYAFLVSIYNDIAEIYDKYNNKIEKEKIDKKEVIKGLKDLLNINNDIVDKVIDELEKNYLMDLII